jgi:hypothetical protein
MSIDEALDGLRDAMGAVGVPGWEASATLADLEEIEAELAPMRLPEAVRQFWTCVDARTLRVQPYPAFTTPGFALQSWRMARDEFAAFQPLALVTIGYTSHACMSVELDVDDSAGGALFRWFVSDPTGFTRCFDGIVEWVEHLARLVRDGRYTRRDGEQGPSLLLLDSDDADIMTPSPRSHPVHGTALHVGGDIVEWPAHWQRANGLQPEQLRLRGATHTIAEVLASPPERELRGTIAGRVVNLMGVGGSTRVRVDDGTGRLDVACHPPATLLGPCIDRWYEFDVVVAAGLRRLPADIGEPTTSSEDPVADLTAVLMARHGGPADATAEAVRRMQAPDA